MKTENNKIESRDGRRDDMLSLVCRFCQRGNADGCYSALKSAMVSAALLMVVPLHGILLTSSLFGRYDR